MIKLIKNLIRPFYHYYVNIIKYFRIYLDTCRLRRIAKISNRKIFYLGIAQHSNLGDIAQYYCIKEWLRHNYSDYSIFEFAADTVVDTRFSFISKLKKCLNENDFIVFQSGYTTQDLGGYHDLMHRIIIDNFPKAKILMMPQTVFFKSPERKKLTSESYNKAVNMLFLARDRVSYNMACEMFPDIKVKQYPDIVTSLIGYYHFDFSRNGVLFCCRNDSEKLYTNDEIDTLRKKIDIIQKTEITDTTKKISYKTIQKDIKGYIENEIRLYAHYKLIITDRYHGTIFSLVANTPVIVLKTNDHKVITGVEWFKGIYDNYVFLAESLDDAYNIACRILNSTYDYKLKPYFKSEYYDKLPELFDKI